MRRWSRYLTWMAAGILIASTAMGAEDWDLLSFQMDNAYRVASGILIMSLILFQWGLTLGRVIFQRTGSQWGRWIDWHLRSAILLPLALLAHSLTLGWGLLGALPLMLLGAAHFGSLMNGHEKIKEYLPYHVGLSALTLALALIHIYMVLMFR